MAFTLLITAMQLLTLVASTPNLPQSFVDNAKQVANTAIVFAQEEINKYQAELAKQATNAPTTTTAPTPPTAPLGVIINQPNPIMENKEDILVKVINVGPKDEVNGLPFGSFSLRISVLDASGKYLEKAPITIKTPDGQKTVEPNGMSTPDLKDWNTTFTYVPKAAGTKSLTFTSGTLSKTIEVIAE